MSQYGGSAAALLRVISGIVHAHHTCGGNRGKLSGSRLSTIFKIASIQVSDTFIVLSKIDENRCKQTVASLP